MSKNLIHVRNLNIGHKDRILYNDINFDITEGDCIMLCGANGSGKTTLLKTLVRTYDNIAMIPTRIPKIAGFTVSEFVRISCFRHSDLGGRLSEHQEKALQEALERSGTAHLASRDLSTLSDGEFQKAGIAAAIARKAPIILLDEPTAFLDTENRIAVLKCIRHICTSTETPAAVIFSTHDLTEGLETANKVFALGADGIFRTSSDDMESVVKTIFRHI